MISNKRLNRWVIFTVAVITGIAFIVLAVETLDYPRKDLVIQLLGIGIFFMLIVLLAGLTAMLIRWAAEFLKNRGVQSDDD